MSLREAVELLNEYHKEIMTFACYGLDRELYGDHYNEVSEGNDKYITTISPREYNPKDPTHRLVQEWELHGEDEREAIKRRGLIKHNGKLYFPEKIVSNIYRDNSYFDFLVCYDFTSSVSHLLKYVHGEGINLNTSSKETAGYAYKHHSPVDVEDRLSILINKDGIYVCQVKFQDEDHAFVIVVIDQTMFILNRYSGKFYIKAFNLAQGLGNLLLLERNIGNNTSLIKEIYGFDPYATWSNYMILGLMQCDYWDKGFTPKDLTNFFQHISNYAFKGRDEAKEIKNIIETLI